MYASYCSARIAQTDRQTYQVVEFGGIFSLNFVWSGLDMVNIALS